MDPIENANEPREGNGSRRSNNGLGRRAPSPDDPRAQICSSTPVNSSIRLMRLPSSRPLLLRHVRPESNLHQAARQAAEPISGRRRSSSEPQRVPVDLLLADHGPSASRAATPLPTLSEETTRQKSRTSEQEQPTGSEIPARGVLLRPLDNSQPVDGVKPGRIRRMSQGARSMLGLNRVATHPGVIEDPALPQGEYEAEVVNLLDVVDPEVSTITTLTNVQNSLFIPDLGNWIDRRPAYFVSPGPRPEIVEDKRASTPASVKEAVEYKSRPSIERNQTQDTIRSTLSDSRFAVRPDGVSLDDWSAEDKRVLNDHVRHMLHSRRSAFKRGLKGFIQYVKKPLGFLVTLYATLITLFGLAWVLFLIGWINVGGKQLYVINVIDNVLVALFAIVGDGLAPFRAIDTYHMIFIAHYHHLTYKLRRKQHLPNLRNKNDLPEHREEELDSTVDIETAPEEATKDSNPEYSVLTAKQQDKLTHHATKFAKSHTFYKPHETTTHHAFPLSILIAVVILLDFHSIFQITLGGVTWGIHYRKRPMALTTTVLCCSLSCNFAAALLIWIGDRRTRKKDVIEKMFRQELTKQAISKLKKEKSKKEEEAEAAKPKHETGDMEDEKKPPTTEQNISPKK